MSPFGSILQNLGFNHPAAEAESPPQTTASPQPVAKLKGLAASNAQRLDWKVTIVDLLKLLDLDSSFAARKEFATELGCPPRKWAIPPR